MPNILAATRDPEAVKTLRRVFGEKRRVTSCQTLAQALDILADHPHDLFFVDQDILATPVQYGRRDWKQELQAVRKAGNYVETVVLAPPDKVRFAVDAVRAGAADYLALPIDADELVYVVESMRESSRVASELDYLRSNLIRQSFPDIPETHSPLMREVFKKVKVAAPTSALVLLTGETGTGKSVIARLVHSLSERKTRQFIGVHCGAIPDTLIESELFGHERGAFTGAHKRKLGKFEIAHGGTIFLDEIGTITHAAQVRLLQVLQERTFQRVGGESSLETDARIIAASNENLKKLAESGSFRTDLYYRLNVFPIEIPPLRERKEDIPLLLRFFLKDFSRKYGKEITDAHQEVVEGLKAYDWPGNVRELQNLVERAFILESGNVLSAESFPQELFSDCSGQGLLLPNTPMTLYEYREAAKEVAERQYLEELLTRHKGRINHSAEQAGISTRQLHKLLTKYGIQKESYKTRGQD